MERFNRDPLAGAARRPSPKRLVLTIPAGMTESRVADPVKRRKTTLALSGEKAAEIMP
jgi:hypothetical protein